MKAFNHFIICFIIVLVSFFMSFYFVFTDSFGAALPDYTLDQSAFEVLEGGNGAYSNTYEFGLNADPNMIVFGVDNILQDINSKMYNKFGWDLEDAAWVVEDSFTDAAKSTLNRNLAAGATGFEFAKLYFTNAWNGTKNFILGFADDSTGKITSTSNNIYTYVDDSFVNSLTSVKTDLIQDQNLYNFSQANHFLYGSSFHFIYGPWENYTVNFSDPLVVGSTYSNGDYWCIGICSEYSYGDHIPCSGVVVSGNNHIIDYAYLRSSGWSVTLNGKTYYGADLGLHCTDGTTYNPFDSVFHGDLRTQVSSLSSLDLSGYYDMNNYNDLKSIIDSLKGTWVTSDDLRQINEKLNELTIGNIVIDGNTLPVIDTNAESLADIESLIEQILERNAEADEILKNLNQNESDPDPEIPNEIPDWVWPSFFPDLLPEDMFSMFKPIFDIVGTQYSMYGLWILIPSILIFVLILYILVSLF